MKYIGGTVLALRGSVHTKQVGHGDKMLLPTDVVGRQQVPTGGEYHFALPSGRYVIDAPHYAGGNGLTYVSVVVRAGKTVHADLPNDCK